MGYGNSHYTPSLGGSPLLDSPVPQWILQGREEILGTWYLEEVPGIAIQRILGFTDEVAAEARVLGSEFSFWISLSGYLFQMERLVRLRM